MKKIFNISFLTIVTLLYSYLVVLNYYRPAQAPLSFRIKHHHDDTIRIAFIGDSWAFYHKYHHCKIGEILKNHIQAPIKIVSEGGCGATSKFLYSRIKTNSPTRKIIEDAPNYCIVSAGINDTQKKMGKNYYQQNMLLIIRFLIQNKITPIIIEIPDYDINKQYYQLNISKKILRRFSMIMTDCKMDCREEFRKELEDKLYSDIIQNKIIIIRRDTWEYRNGQHDWTLYRCDRLHLNNHGNEVLDSCISENIIKHIQKHNSN